MPSPFPGMDPYLERHWLDVHADLISLARTALNKTLPGDLVARMEERFVIDQLDGSREHVIYPDVRVYQDPDHPYGPGSPGSSTGVAEPIVLELEVEPRSETYITIVNTDGEQLVTTIEFLSRTN